MGDFGGYLRKITDAAQQKEKMLLSLPRVVALVIRNVLQALGMWTFQTEFCMFMSKVEIGVALCVPMPRGTRFHFHRD